MQAVQIMAPGHPRFVDAPKPTLKPGHALIRTLLLSLCGSDVHMVHYHDPKEYPLPVGATGHEMIGLVEAIDAPDSGIQPGDLTLTLAPQQTAMAEYYLAPIDDVLPLPGGKPLEHFLMAQQLGTVIFACKRLPNVMGKDAAVIGQGSAGLHFNAMLRRMGATRVIAMDVIDARVAMARQFGATHALNITEVDPYDLVSEITQGRLADIVIEAAGEIETINLTAKLVKVGGNLLYFGVPRGPHIIEFDYWELFRKYCHTTSSGASALEAGRASFRMALDLIASGAIDVSSMPTHRFAFEQVFEAYELARTRDDGVIKVVIEMPGYQQIVR